MSAWSPESWQTFPIKQQPHYENQQLVDETIAKLSCLPAVVSVKEVEKLRMQLAEVAQGKRFLLQGGDCAERFQDCQPDLIEKKLRIMLQMSLVLVWGARIPVVRVGRMAGQFAKPRSKETEIVDGKEIPTFRGENVNGFHAHERTPDPNRLLQGYFHSVATMNYGRVLLSDGFGDIHDAGTWDLGFVQESKRKAEYENMVQQISDSLHFVHTCGVDFEDNHLSTVDLFISHEGLGLAYEQAMTRFCPQNKKHYNLGTDMLWIGDRTRQIDHAHIEYFRGISNPIGIKVGPSMKPGELVPLIEKLWPNPEETPGKITLITRFGAGKVRDHLPRHIKDVQKAGLKVVWSCDPCHGNTTVAENGYKTRSFGDILAEIKESLEVHGENNSYLGGVHIEMTGENVTECTGGPEDLLETDLPHKYTTFCDPRLNYSQSMEVAFLLAKSIAERAQGHQVSKKRSHEQIQ